jgi:hypothetical protein
MYVSFITMQMLLLLQVLLILRVQLSQKVFYTMLANPSLPSF